MPGAHKGGIKMLPNKYIHHVMTAVSARDGSRLAELLSLEDIHTEQVFAAFNVENRQSEVENRPYRSQFVNRLPEPWGEMCVFHFDAILFLKQGSAQHYGPDGDVSAAYAAQDALGNIFYKYMTSDASPTSWILPVLYTMCLELRQLAQRADALLQDSKRTKMEECSRLFQKCFSACVNDRSNDMLASRKMGTYYMAVALFKLYFKLKSTALCKNIIRGIDAAELPPLEVYPKSHQTAYNYYMGVFAFLDERYKDAETRFLQALKMVHRTSFKNIQLILDYLIPVLLVRGIFPADSIFQQSPQIRQLYYPFISAFKTGNIYQFDQQLKVAEKRLIQRGTYLVLERAREGVIRAAMKKAWAIEHKKNLVSVDVFRAAYNAASRTTVDTDEMECILANLIYNGLVKGYISHGHGMVVLSKERPFPWYEPFKTLTAVEANARAAREKAAFEKAT